MMGWFKLVSSKNKPVGRGYPTELDAFTRECLAAFPVFFSIGDGL
jgi:hypothetical protein